jgi:hypothetical protein
MGEGLVTADSEDGWYFSRNGQQQGPVSRSDLISFYKDKRLLPADYVWCPAFTDWRTMADVFGPAPTLKPPPLPPQAAHTSPSQKSSPASDYRVAEPNYDFTIEDKKDSLVFNTKTGSAGAYGCWFAAGVVVFTLSFFVMLFGLISSQPGVIVFGAITMGLSLFCRVLMRVKKTTSIIFDRDSIVKDGKKYLYNHISSVGFENKLSNSSIMIPGGTGIGVGMASAMASTTVFAQEQAGYYVYIIYGTDKIPIISGLSPDNVQTIYGKVVEFMNRFGYNFAT